MHGKPRTQPLLGLALQLRRFCRQLISLVDVRTRLHEPRQDRLLAFGPEGAALRDLDRVRQRLGQIGKQNAPSHPLILKMMLARNPPPVVLR